MGSEQRSFSRYSGFRMTAKNEGNGQVNDAQLKSLSENCKTDTSAAKQFVEKVERVSSRAQRGNCRSRKR
jgi:hypothetical protein